MYMKDKTLRISLLRAFYCAGGKVVRLLPEMLSDLSFLALFEGYWYSFIVNSERKV